MHSLIVIANPNPNSLTHAVAQRIAQGITASGTQHSTELADLIAEGFNPLFDLADQDCYVKGAVLPEDVASEQERLDRADAVVIVYPIYWWSFPAVLKGWIDRVFTQGWAYDEGDNGKVAKKLQRMNVHLVAIGGANEGTFTRRGYAPAMKKQIDDGIFDFCGAQVLSSSLLLASDTGYPHAHLETGYQIGRNVFASQF